METAVDAYIPYLSMISYTGREPVFFTSFGIVGASVSELIMGSSIRVHNPNGATIISSSTYAFAVSVRIIGTEKEKETPRGRTDKRRVVSL